MHPAEKTRNLCVGIFFITGFLVSTVRTAGVILFLPSNRVVLYSLEQGGSVFLQKMVPPLFSPEK